MTKQEMKAIMQDAAEQKKLMNLYFRFDSNYYNAVPLLIDDKLFLAVNEDDFILDGFTIFRIKDLAKVKIKNDKCDQIVRKEGLLEKLMIPSVDISTWQTVFESLKKINQNVIVENQSLDENECDFTIGSIEQIYKTHVYIRHFDADGIWQEKPYRIAYSHITNVTFLSRYVTVFSKYLDK